MTLAKINSCKGFIVSLIKLQVLRISILKRDSNTGFFLWILWIIQEHLFCIESMNGWFLNTSASFWKTLLLQTGSGFEPATLLKMRLRQSFLSVTFAKFLRTSLDRTSPNDCFLCLTANFEKFFRSPPF